jgi:hypothetical protein
VEKERQQWMYFKLLYSDFLSEVFGAEKKDNKLNAEIVYL